MNMNYHKFYKMIDNLFGLKAVSMITYLFYLLSLNLLIISMQGLIDDVSQANFSLEMGMLLKYFVLLTSFFIFTLLFQIPFRKLVIKGKNRFLLKLNEHLLNKSFAFFKKHNETELNSMFQNDAVSLASTISTVNLIIIIQSISLLVSAMIMMYYQPILSLLIFSFIALCFICTNFISKKIARLTKSVFEKKQETIQLLLESIKNIKMIKQLKKMQFFQNRFAKFVENDMQPLENKHSDYSAFYICVYSVLSIGLPLLTIGVGILFVVNGSMSIGKLIAMYTLVSQTQEPIRIIADSINDKNAAYELANRMAEVFFDQNEEEELDERKRSLHVNHIDEIHFAINEFYYGEAKVLSNIDFMLQKGDRLHIQGESGSGKSTFVSLLMQYLEDHDNDIRINNMDANEINLYDLYDHMLMVDQNYVLLEGTIAQNIHVFDSYSEAEIMEVINTCQLQDFVDEHGLNYLIKPNANNLSGGQVQRLCIARMLIRKPDVLILDEPTSALDEMTSEGLSFALKNYAEKYHITLCIISHKHDITKICNKTLTIQKEYNTNNITSE